jgi:hypothetical protein
MFWQRRLMPQNVISEVKTVRGKKSGAGLNRRDKTMTGGERAETPREKAERKHRKQHPPEPPIIQKDVT